MIRSRDVKHEKRVIDLERCVGQLEDIHDYWRATEEVPAAEIISTCNELLVTCNKLQKKVGNAGNAALSSRLKRQRKRLRSISKEMGTVSGK